MLFPEFTNRSLEPNIGTNCCVGKSPTPRPFDLPSLAFLNIATLFILEYSLLYSPLRTLTLLYLQFSLLAVDLLPVSYIPSPLSLI